MSECTHDCGSCSQNCAERKSNPADFLEQPNSASSIKKVIGIVSGKGGVGKSLVTSMLAVLMNRRGYHSAIMDADVTGPSIPKAFGIHEKALGIEGGILPVRSKTGIDVISLNLLLENESDPVVDMPPGTGDVPLTVFQSIPLDGILVVASPQELVSMIVEKAVKMANLMNIPILGLIENMSYIVCPDCGKQLSLFGESHIDAIGAQYKLPVLAKLPVDPKIAGVVDAGVVELFEGDWLDGAADLLEKL